MARVRIRAGEVEVEIDSRDFYVDNKTIRAVIEEVLGCLPAPKARPASGEAPELQEGGRRRRDCAGGGGGAPPSRPRLQRPEGAGATVAAALDDIADAEAYEPEFSGDAYAPERHSYEQIREELLGVLDSSAFFDSPRTVSDIAQRLWKDGWHASSLEISKSLVEMTARREIVRLPSKDSPAGTTYVSTAAHAVPGSAAGSCAPESASPVTGV